ncbi:amidohydrolase family protein [Microbacterium sp. NPDC028030]|uniref:amidohydrolase family protein n=1 Tax=Microbacterium sp. NPDC028030 TaxID=3155124 RepID=UPI0033C2A368
MTGQARRMLGAFADLGAVDTTCFVGQWPYRLGAAADADDLRAHAERFGLRAIWVSHLASLFGFDTRTGNEAVLAACADDPLFRVVVTIDPRDADWTAQLDEAIGSGARGVRVAPGFHRYDVAGVRPVLEACGEHGIPLQLIARLDDARVRHPLSPAVDIEVHRIADLVREAPTLPMLLSGLNRADWIELNRHLGDAAPERVRLDLWHVNGPTHVADRLAEDPQRWVFGSGFPVQTPEATALQLAASALPAETLRAITSGNAAALLP